MGFRGLTFKKSLAAFSAEHQIEPDGKDDESYTRRAKHIIPPRTKCKDDVYTIGIDLEGNTIVRLQSDDTNMTLTLTPYSVRKMIQMLEATLDDEDGNYDEDGYEKTDSEYNK